MLARKQAVVTVEQNQLNDDIIVAFVISNFSKEEIYDAIRKQLPDYMIPSKMIYLEEIPLTVNGKVDYNQLHDIFIEDLSNGTYIPAKNEFEEKIVSVIAEVLKLEKFGINWNYIEKGGNAINAIRAVSKINELGLKCSVRDLLLSRDIGDFIRIITTRQDTIPQENHNYQELLGKLRTEYGSGIETAAPITPTQRYMYKAYKEHKIGDNFLQYVYRINGRYSYDLLYRTISLLPLQYDSLSSRIIEFEGDVIQIISTDNKIPVKEIKVLSDEEMKEYMRRDVLRSFDVKNENLIRFTVFIFPDDTVKLLCSVSHMIVDGWSMDLLINTIDRNYQLMLSGTSIDELTDMITVIPHPSITSYNWLVCQKTNQESMDYWNAYFADSEAAVMTITHDNAEKSSFYWEIVSYINEDDCIYIRQVCHRLGITENTLFEYAFAYLQRQEDI